MLTIHDEEKLRREDFENTFDRHFLNALFIGLDDDPPAFATQPPAIFDNRLPNLSKLGIKKFQTWEILNENSESNLFFYSM